MMSGRWVSHTNAAARLGAAGCSQLSRASGRQRDILDRALLVTVIVVSFGSWLLSGPDSDVAAGSWWFVDAFWAIASTLAFFGALAERRHALPALCASRPLIFILLLAAVSTVWSADSFITLRRAEELFGSTAIALYFSCRLRLRDFVATLSVAIAITAGLSLVLIVFFPTLGNATGDHGWNGIFDHKNHLGPAMLLGMTCLVCLIDKARSFARRCLIAAFFTFLVLLIGSQNVAAIASALLLTLLIPILFWSRANCHSKGALLLVLGLSTVIAAALSLSLSFDPDGLLTAVGKDPSLTGRTELWRILAEAIADRPALGYGYGAFWGDNAPSASLVYPYQTWTANTAHDGFLEVAIELGLVGVALLTVLLLVYASRAWSLFLSGNDQLSGWPLFILLYTLLTNLTDATFLRYNWTDWIVFVAAFLYSAQVDPRLFRQYDEPAAMRTRLSRHKRASV